MTPSGRGRRMKMLGSRAPATVLVSVLVTLLGLGTGVSPATAAGDRTRLVPYDGVAFDGFGSSIDVDGGTVVVGASSAGVTGRIGVGAVYVFTDRAGGRQQVKLVDSESRPLDGFGTAVAISGDTVVVGTPRDNTEAGKDAGSVSVFVRAAEGWTQQAKLTPPDAAEYAGFGRSVDIDGDTMVVTRSIVASSGPPIPPPAAYVYVRTGDSWELQTQILVLSAGVVDTDVALAGDTLAIGVPEENTAIGTEVGAVHIYGRTGTTWSEQARLDDPAGSAQGMFGRAVALDGGTLAVLSWRYVGEQSDPPAVTIFAGGGSAWSVQSRLRPPSDAAESYTGWSVAVSGDHVVVGSPFADTAGGTNAGEAFLYARTGPTWNRVERLSAGAYARSEAQYGWSVGIDADRVVVGAIRDPGTQGAGTGAAYVYLEVGS